MPGSAAFTALPFLAAPAAAATAPPSPYAAVTAGDFAAGCERDTSSCAAMVGEVLMNRMQFSPTSHICLPGADYANGVPAWLKAHPETAGMPAHDGIYLAITSLYRCGA